MLLHALAVECLLTCCSLSAGSVVLTGSMTTFPDQTVDTRQTILQSWATSRFGILRLLLRQLTLISKQLWARTSPNLRPLIGIPRVPVYGSVGEGFDYGFLQLPPGDEPEVLRADVVVVGSGCGGGVCAKELAEAGLDVLVVDKGYYWPPEYLPMTDVQGPSHLFMNDGQITCEYPRLADLSRPI